MRTWRKSRRIGHTVLIKQKKLPLSLLADPEKGRTRRVNLLGTSPFSRDVQRGTSARRNRNSLLTIWPQWQPQRRRAARHTLKVWKLGQSRIAIW